MEYKTSCKGCEFRGDCFFEGADKMVNHKCFIDALSEKLKMPQEKIIKKSNKWRFDFWHLSNVILTNFGDWRGLSNRKRSEILREILRHFDITLSTSDHQLIIAILNCYTDAWREEYIICKNCGAIVENSKQRNRFYCEKCAGYHPMMEAEKIRICKDCGQEFYFSHNRQIRCEDCQFKHDKEKAREYSRKYRQKKRQALE